MNPLHLIGCAAVWVSLLFANLGGLAGDGLRAAEGWIFRNRKKVMSALLALVAWHLAETGKLSGTDFLLIAYSWIQGRGHGREKGELAEQLRATHGTNDGAYAASVAEMLKGTAKAP